MDSIPPYFSVLFYHVIMFYECTPLQSSQKLWHDTACTKTRQAKPTQHNTKSIVTVLFLCLQWSQGTAGALFQNGVDSHPWGAVQRVLGNVATRINVSDVLGCIIDTSTSCFLVKMRTHCGENGLIRIAHHGATAFLCGRN